MILRSAVSGSPRRRRDRGVVLVAALVFVATLATLVTVQLSRLPFTTSESRGAVAVVRRELDATSALQLAIGILRTDAGLNAHDCFGDLWARPHTVEVAGARIRVELSDRAFARIPDDGWLRHDYGVPEGVNLLTSEDPAVHALLDAAPPNVNTGPLSLLSRRYGISNESVTWLRGRREAAPLLGPHDFASAPGFTTEAARRRAEGFAFASRVFLAEATVSRPGEPDRPLYWVLQRSGADVAVLYSGPGGTP
jgi:hypothetical protein